MAADVSSVARLLRGEAVAAAEVGKNGASAIVTRDFLGGCGAGAGDEVVDLDVKVPAGWERRLDLMSGKTYLTPHHQTQNQQDVHDLNLPPPAAAASTAVCTLAMVRSALERATAARAAAAASPAASSSSASSSNSSSSSGGKRHRSPPADTARPSPPAMRAAACPACLTYVLIAEVDPRCPRCGARVPPLGAKSGNVGGGSGKKPRIDLNSAAEETD